MKSVCSLCGRVHGSDWARAVGRFGPSDRVTYRAVSDGQLRSTRTEAENDECAKRAGIG
jgi:hypothetical protein